MRNNRATGKTYEDEAVKHLESKGFAIIQRNFWCKIGEIDIIAQKDGYIIFIEVKYRKNKTKGEPWEAVNYKKQQKIKNIARYYLMLHHYQENTPCRFDVVTILGDQLYLYENAFI